MESIFAILQQWISSGSLWFAAAGAFIGGALTAMCPCVLVMVPLLIGFIGGMGQEMTTMRSFLYTSVFILGFSLELAVLFTVGMAAAPFLQSEYMVYVVAAICVFLGLNFMGVIPIPLQISQYKPPRHTGLLGAAIFGFVFGFISLPCTGPVLMLIVSVIPVLNPLHAGIIMLFYGIGTCIFLLVVGTFAGAARHLLASRRLNTANLLVKKAAGALLVLVGVYISVGSLFPSLGLPM